MDERKGIGVPRKAPKLAPRFGFGLVSTKVSIP